MVRKDDNYIIVIFSKQEIMYTVIVVNSSRRQYTAGMVGFVPFGANLTYFGVKPTIPDTVIVVN